MLFLADGGALQGLVNLDGGLLHDVLGLRDDDVHGGLVPGRVQGLGGGLVRPSGDRGVNLLFLRGEPTICSVSSVWPKLNVPGLSKMVPDSFPLASQWPTSLLTVSYSLATSFLVVQINVPLCRLLFTVLFRDREPP